MKYFYSSFLITLAGLVIAYFLGGLVAVYVCLLLCILEISLSFDNAVVNAKVLHTMSKQWQKRFITFGIPVAVFGMRFLFPILIVAIAANISIYETLDIAINNPLKYEQALVSNKDGIYVFGGAFLLMVFLSFFFSKDKEVHWLGFLEDNFITRFLSQVSGVPIIIALIVGIVIMSFSKSYSISIAYFIAILLYKMLHSLDDFFSSNAVRSGLMGFLYLEVLDASFSFDGVIGAFALSNNIFIIMIGLGSGAMFVRSLTIYFVEKNTLQSLRFLEHGAHYAILAIAVIMFIKVYEEVSEVLTGTIGIVLIFLAFLSSLKKPNS